LTVNPYFPDLETDRLILRSIIPDDLEFVFQHFSDPMVNQYLLDNDPVETREQAQEIIDFYVPPKSKFFNRWIILLKIDKHPIGTCGFHKWNEKHGHAEIGYDLGAAHWHKGYMTEVLQVVLHHGFDKMKLNRIEAIVYPENRASLRLLERLGFQKEGLLRQSTRQGDKYYDHWILSLLKEDWLSR